MTQYIFHAILFVLGFLGTYFMIPLFKSMLLNSNVIRPNYKKIYPLQILFENINGS